MTPAAAEADRTSLPATVPLRSVGGHLLVDVSFGGDGSPLPMLLDTGAPTLIPPSLAAELGASPVGRARLAPLGGEARDVPVVRIPEVRIGQARFTDVPALVAAPDAGSTLADLAGNGIVGGSLLAAAVWHIDYPARQLTMAADTTSLAHVAGAAMLRITPTAPDAPSPLVDLRIDGTTVPTLLDTGSDAGLVLHPDALAVAHEDAAPRTAVLDGWDGRERVAAWSTIAEVALGSGHPQRRSVRLTTALPPGTAIAGNRFLSGHVLTIDIQSGLVHISQV
jgi:predicted aspartyl protease